jgi:molybdopterin synthase catalytic subunit
MNASVVVAATITEAPLSADTALAAVQSTGCGAVVSFSGIVRNHDGGRKVDALSYSAHPSPRSLRRGRTSRPSICCLLRPCGRH